MKTLYLFLIKLMNLEQFMAVYPETCIALKKCSVCGVTIDQEAVLFSSGEPGTRARLYARVCRYVQKKGCINQDKERIGEVLRSDCFGEGKELEPLNAAPMHIKL